MWVIECTCLRSEKLSIPSLVPLHYIWLWTDIRHLPGAISWCHCISLKPVETSMLPLETFMWLIYFCLFYEMFRAWFVGKGYFFFLFFFYSIIQNLAFWFNLGLPTTILVSFYWSHSNMVYMCYPTLYSQTSCTRLIHSHSLVQQDCQWAMRHDLQLAGIRILWSIGRNIEWDCLVPHNIMGSRDQWELPPFFRPQWQPLCTSLNGRLCKGTVKEFNVARCP